MDEINLIETYFAPLAGPEGLGLKDDAAELRLEPGFDLILTKDTLVEGVHFPTGRFGADVAEKLLRVNLSDLAAKGAKPVGYLLSLAFPKVVDNAMLRSFSNGLGNLQQAYDFTLFGGDTVSTEGPVVATVTMIGTVPNNQMVKRSGARSGDDVWVSGHIGDGYLGLKTVLGEPQLSPSREYLSFWENAYWRPKPRLIMRQLLRAYASAATDVSDGLIGDLNHICQASHVGMQIDFDSIPFSEPTQSWLAGKIDREEASVTLVTAGDDYEIAFTAGEEFRSNIEGLARDLGLTLTRLGKCGSGSRAELVTASGRIIPVGSPGYVHFKEKTR